MAAEEKKAGRPMRQVAAAVLGFERPMRSRRAAVVVPDFERPMRQAAAVLDFGHPMRQVAAAAVPNQRERLLRIDSMLLVHQPVVACAANPMLLRLYRQILRPSFFHYCGKEKEPL